jgi:putative glycosyltransferase (TIGR04348 family)
MRMSNKPTIAIISPALANANNGNWQTAFRWARHLRDCYRVSLLSSGSPVTARPHAAIALHARRSAPSISALAAQFPGLPVALVLTGTDLYRDIHVDAEAQRSLQLARRLVVLQEAGMRELAPVLRTKTSVIYQSAPALKPLPRDAAQCFFKVAMIGHLREEKDPATFMRAACRIDSRHVRLLHIGGALDAGLGMTARKTERDCARYRWLGDLPHAATRQQLKRCSLMAISSRMEGGANVIIEAVTCGVPVVASDISGNRGMLGEDYAGYFPVGDAGALAALIDRAATDPAFYARLQSQCAARAPLFTPAREKAAVLQLVDNLVSTSCSRPLTG